MKKQGKSVQLDNLIRRNLLKLNDSFEITWALEVKGVSVDELVKELDLLRVLLNARNI
jgi:hypothetical protein